MNATIYWARHKLQQGTRDLRWAAKLWWFKQEVDFLGWRWRMESHLPDAAVPATAPLTAQGGSHAMQPLPLLHG